MTDMYSAEFQDAEIGGDKFWMLVQTMPNHQEAICLIDLARLHFQRLIEQNVGGAERMRIQNTLQKLNIERTRINMAIEDMSVKAAVIAVFGHDGWADVRSWMAAKRAGNIS